MQDYEKRYRDLRAAGLPGWAGDCHAGNRLKLAAMLDDLQQSGLLPPAPCPALELGCGNAAMAALLLAERGYRVHGIDISPTAIDWAHETFEAAGLAGHFIRGDVRTMPDFDAASFALVFDGACLHCLIGADRSLCLAEIRRILQPGGIFIASTMCGPPRSPEACARYDVERQCLVDGGVPSRTLRPLPALLAELGEAGFDIVDHRIRRNPWWDHATIIACPAPRLQNL